MTLQEIYHRIKAVLFGKKAPLDTDKHVNTADTSVKYIETMDEMINSQAESGTVDTFTDMDDLPFEQVPEPVKEPVKAAINPLKPFKRNFLGLAEGQPPHPDAVVTLTSEFEKQGRPLTIEQYETLFNDLLNLKNFLHEEKAPILKKLWEDSRFIYEALTPLHQLGLSFTLDITGGAARDFVLNKHNKIKDIDFMVSISNTNESLTGLNKEKLISIFGAEEIERTDILNTYRRNEIIKSLIELCMCRVQDCQEVFFFSNRKNTEPDPDGYKQIEFSKNRLVAVVKNTGSKTHFPCDLLVTDYIKPQFLDDFDYDICKASFSIVNDYYHTTFPKHFSHLISRFSAETCFFADVANKTITYNSGGRSKSQIDASINKHLPRLVDKYEDYNPIVIHPMAPNFEYAKANTMKAVVERGIAKHNAQKSDEVEKKAIKRLKI